MPSRLSPTPESPDNQAIRELRDSVKELNKSIQKMDKNTTDFSKVIAALTAIILVVAIMQIAVSIMIDFPGWKGLVVQIVTLVIILYFSRKIFKAAKILKITPCPKTIPAA